MDLLLKDSFIRPSTSPQASPIECVLKKTIDSSGEPEVCLTVDFRYVNPYTKSFPFPVQDQQRILDFIG